MKRTGWYGAVIAGMLLLLSGCSGKPEAEGGSQAVSAGDLSAGQEAQAWALQMTFLDTGKSDCIVIETGTHVVVNDAADLDDWESICDFLKERQIEDIDYLILSHFDKDHIGSAAALLSKYRVGCVLMPAYEETSEQYLALTRALEETKTESRRLTEDYEFTLDNAAFYVDAPDAADYEDDNNYSLITAVSCGETRLLLMGDALKKRTGEFLESEAGKADYDLIKMPHHGDYNKKLPELFAAADPDWVVLTAGAERSRVEDKTLALLERSGCQVYYTDEGNVTVLSDGARVTVRQ